MQVPAEELVGPGVWGVFGCGTEGGGCDQLLLGMAFPAGCWEKPLPSSVIEVWGAEPQGSFVLWLWLCQHRLCSCWWLCPSAPFREAGGEQRSKQEMNAALAPGASSPRGEGCLQGLKSTSTSKYWPGCARLNRCCVLGLAFVF